MRPLSSFPLWKRIEQKRFLAAMNLEITARCNNDCRHCYINRPADDLNARSQELRVDEIFRIADEAVEMGCLWCLITGGEPLLRPDFEEIYIGLRRRGLLVSVFTNATLIQAKHIALFKRFPPRNIEVTVYGVSQETYGRVTQRPALFSSFQKGLHLLLENGIKVRLKTMAMRSNYQELPAIAEYYRPRSSGSFRFDPFLHLRYDGNPERNALIRQERLSPEEIIDLEKKDIVRFDALLKHCDNLIFSETKAAECNHLFYCKAGKDTCDVGPDGTFRLCSALWAPGTTRSLRNTSLRKAWEELGKFLKELTSDREEFLLKCKNCNKINLCMWCPAMAYLETGSMDAHVDYFCRIANARAELIQNGRTSS
ncbi:radical SAM protein [bacterium]|nr:radical SAM protein [bacterium]